ncbi:MAG: hypothetical protein GX605_09695, partial [Chloroflexi bacterium]|nr:hypothetical protein [Chloroflexota bacterium]
MIPALAAVTTPGAAVEQTGPGRWRLTVPGGTAAQYRLAQLDDYRERARRALPWRGPLRLALRARVSEA